MQHETDILKAMQNLAGLLRHEYNLLEKGFSKQAYDLSEKKEQLTNQYVQAVGFLEKLAKPSADFLTKIRLLNDEIMKIGQLCLRKAEILARVNQNLMDNIFQRTTQDRLPSQQYNQQARTGFHRIHSPSALSLNQKL